MDGMAVAESFAQMGLASEFQDLLAELDRVGEEAGHGHELNAMEGVILTKGRELLRKSLENRLQARIDAVEKKGAPTAPKQHRLGEKRASGQSA